MEWRILMVFSMRTTEVWINKLIGMRYLLEFHLSLGKLKKKLIPRQYVLTAWAWIHQFQAQTVQIERPNSLSALEIFPITYVWVAVVWFIEVRSIQMKWENFEMDTFFIYCIHQVGYCIGKNVNHFTCPFKPDTNFVKFHSEKIDTFFAANPRQNSWIADLKKFINNFGDTFNQLNSMRFVGRVV